MAFPGVSRETRLFRIADSPQAPFTVLSMLGNSAAGHEKAILPEVLVSQANV